MIRFMVESREKRRLPVSVSAAVYIVDDEGRLLLLKQAAKEKVDRWGPPGGGMHPHESPVDTAERETREEIGVDIDLIDLIGIYTVDRGNEATGLGFVFRGRILSDKIKLGEGEIADYRFFTIDEIKMLFEENMFYKPEYNKASVEDWLKGNSYSIDIIKKLNI